MSATNPCIVSLSLVELTQILATSRNTTELLWVWKNWRDATGIKMRPKYIRFAELLNEAATLNGRVY